MAKKTIKKQKAKKSTLRFLVFGVACIIISGTVALSISKLWSEIYQKYKEKKDLDQKHKYNACMQITYKYDMK